MNHDWEFIHDVTVITRNYSGRPVRDLADNLRKAAPESDDVPRTLGIIDDLLDLIDEDEVIYPEDLTPEQLEAIYIAGAEFQRVLGWYIKVRRAAQKLAREKELHPSRAGRRQ